MLKKLRQKIEDIRWEDAANPSRWVKFAHTQVRLGFYVLRELVRNRCPLQAAALTFTTLLSLVPLLAVAFSFFRGFAALEQVQQRAQDAIFETILAGPLLNGAPVPEGEGAAEQVEPRLEMEPAQLLAEAESRHGGGDVALTLHLYFRALEQGADAARGREGMSRLRFSALPSLRRAFGAIGPGARRAYLEAAGLKGDAATEAGPLLAAGEESRSRAAEELAAGRLAGAIESGRESLLAYSDAVLVASGTQQEKELREIARQHEQARRLLGEGFRELGRQEANLYHSLQESADLESQQAFEAALKNLREAALLADHSSEMQWELGDLLAAAGRHKEAAEQYRLGLQKGREVAARGISLKVVDYLRLFIDKVGRAEIGIIGILFLLVTATSLLNTIEKTLNHIWKVSKRRPFWIRFTSFCTFIWLGPALVGTTVWVHERLGTYLAPVIHRPGFVGRAVGLMTAAGEMVLPFVTTWLILLALYIFLPHTRVRFRSAAWGAFLGAALLTAARPLFQLYVLNAVKYQKIYGSLGAVPIFLLWIWLLWLIVLFGAEISFTAQNVDLLRYRDKLSRLSDIFIDRYLAARVMMYVAREFWDTGRPVSAGRLAEILEITSEEAADAAGRLVQLGLLIPVGERRDEFHPARDLSRLKLSEVLSIMDRFRDDSRSSRPEDKPYEDKLEAVFESAIESQEQALDAMTFRDLLEACERDRNKWPKPSSERAD